jgi:hypothetical protein
VPWAGGFASFSGRGLPERAAERSGHGVTGAGVGRATLSWVSRARRVRAAGFAARGGKENQTRREPKRHAEGAPARGGGRRRSPHDLVPLVSVEPGPDPAELGRLH